MNLITRIAAYWRKRFTNTDATSCAGQIPCPECVVVSLDNEHMHVDWCARCGVNIFRLPGGTVWRDRDGDWACEVQGMLTHEPLLSAYDAETKVMLAIMAKP